VAPLATEPLKRLIPDARRTDLVLSAGHVGLIVGRQARKHSIPAMLDWLEAHSDQTQV
jgi:polyhydroxyalkanoate synthase